MRSLAAPVYRMCFSRSTILRSNRTRSAASATSRKVVRLREAARLDGGAGCRARGRRREMRPQKLVATAAHRLKGSRRHRNRRKRRDPFRFRPSTRSRCSGGRQSGALRPCRFRRSGRTTCRRQRCRGRRRFMNGLLRACGGAIAAVPAALLEVEAVGQETPAFGVVAPPAGERTAFEEDCRTNAGAVVRGKAHDVENDAGDLRAF